jgi:predicted membrane metal-binding protein
MSAAPPPQEKLPPVPGPEVIECDATPIHKQQAEKKEPSGLSQLTSISGKQIAVIAGSVLVMMFMMRISAKIAVLLGIGALVYFWFTRDEK